MVAAEIAALLAIMGLAKDQTLRRGLVGMPKDICSDVQYRRTRIADHLMHGETSVASLAIAFGVTSAMIRYDIKAIRKNWLSERPKLAREKVAVRLVQLDNVLHMTLVDFERSRQGKEEITTVMRACDHPLCQGGFHVDKVSLRKAICFRCNGDGEIEVVTKKVTRMPGNPAFLSVAKECIVECARLEGVHPSIASNLRTAARKVLPDGTVLEKIEDICQVSTMPLEYIVEALTQLDTIRARIAAGPSPVVIDVEATTKDTDGQQG